MYNRSSHFIRIESPMGRTAMNLSFHQTFPPERDCLARLLELASDMPPMQRTDLTSDRHTDRNQSGGGAIQYEVMG